MHPVLLQLGPVKVYAYGTFLALAFLTGTYAAAHFAARKGRDPDLVMRAALYIVLGAILGSRLLYVLLDPGPYIERPIMILELYEGGLSLHGGVAGGIIAGLVVAVRNRAPFWPYADIVAPSIALGTGIARIGCFLNGCCYGILTDGSWGVLTRYAPGLRHPSQLYEMALAFVLFAYLVSRLRNPAYDGQVMLHYIIGYSVVRFLVEFSRDSGYVWSAFSLAQVASVGIIVIFGGASLWLGRRGGSEPSEDPPDA